MPFYFESWIGSVSLCGTRGGLREADAQCSLVPLTTNSCPSPFTQRPVYVTLDTEPLIDPQRTSAVEPHAEQRALRDLALNVILDGYFVQRRHGKETIIFFCTEKMERPMSISVSGSICRPWGVVIEATFIFDGGGNRFDCTM